MWCVCLLACVFHLSLFILGLDFQSYLLGLDFLPQPTIAFPVKRNLVGSAAQGTQFSPLHALVGSPIKEEEEHPETDSKKISLGKQESKDILKQVFLLWVLFLESWQNIAAWRKEYGMMPNLILFCNSVHTVLTQTHKTLCDLDELAFSNGR